MKKKHEYGVECAIVYGEDLDPDMPPVSGDGQHVMLRLVRWEGTEDRYAIPMHAFATHQEAVRAGKALLALVSGWP